MAMLRCGGMLMTIGGAHQAAVGPRPVGEVMFSRRRTSTQTRCRRAALPPGVKPHDHESSPFAELGLYDIWEGTGTTRARQHVNPLRAEFQLPFKPVDWNEVYEDPTRPLVLDLGCGPGRFLLLLHHRQKPDDAVTRAAGGVNYLGVEIRRSLVERSNEWAQRMECGKNIHFLFTNATLSLKDALSNYPGPLHSCYIQFPDPHFKRRYHKRRIFQPSLIRTIEERLPPGGQLFLQSDVLAVSVAMRNMFEYYAKESFTPAENHIPNDPNVVFYEELPVEQLEGSSTDSSTEVQDAEEGALPTEAKASLNTASSAEPIAGPDSDESSGGSSSDGGSGSGSGGASGSGGGGGRRPAVDTDRMTSEWSKYGWLKENPMGAPTEREVYVQQQNLPVYRILLTRK